MQSVRMVCTGKVEVGGSGVRTHGIGTAVALSALQNMMLSMTRRAIIGDIGATHAGTPAARHQRVRQTRRSDCSAQISNGVL